MITLNTITVIGAGTMGHSLALLFARAGSRVTLCDINRDILDVAAKKIASSLETFNTYEPSDEPSAAVLGRLSYSTDTPASVRTADMVLEVVVENPDIKRRVFADLAPHLRADAVVSSNTSVLNIFELVPETLLPRAVMTHFFVPPHIIPLVEIVGNEKTDPAIAPALKAYLEKAGMAPVVLDRFIPGFIINRIQRAVFREAYSLVGNGIIDAEQFDLAIKASLGIRYPIQGVLQNRDMSGIDSTLNVWKSQVLGLVNNEDAPPILEKMVAEGRLGVKAGKGFYDYSGKTPAEVNAASEAQLFQMRKLMRETGNLKL